jgi:nucleoid-associated protein YgaU
VIPVDTFENTILRSKRRAPTSGLAPTMRTLLALIVVGSMAAGVAVAQMMGTGSGVAGEPRATDGPTVTHFAPREGLQVRAEPERRPPATTAAPGVMNRDTRPEQRRYTVQRGDTLWAIASRHYDDVLVGMRRIKNANRLRRSKVLAGEVLLLPKPLATRGDERPSRGSRRPALGRAVCV